MNLFEHVTITDNLSEHSAAYFMDHLLSALEYLHNLNIVHLAIKVKIIICFAMYMYIYLYMYIYC